MEDEVIKWYKWDTIFLINKFFLFCKHFPKDTKDFGIQIDSIEYVTFGGLRA